MDVVRIYKNIGLYDPLNYNYESVPALDIPENAFPSTIKVKATWETLKDVDHCAIRISEHDYYYCEVQIVRMHAVDVAELYLIGRGFFEERCNTEFSKEEQLYMLVDALACEVLYKMGYIAPTRDEKEKILRLICKHRGCDYDRLFG